jgi:hypothetical protein
MAEARLVETRLLAIIQGMIMERQRLLIREANYLRGHGGAAAGAGREGARPRGDNGARARWEEWIMARRSEEVSGGERVATAAGGGGREGAPQPGRDVPGPAWAEREDRAGAQR